ncbi:tetraspanin-33-like [Rhipicephalus sanguineus]|uniref:tetraspanin-33-like n=1 Tax=Rhipicephalus sanguineus TaxID=34632 RepID=UPI0020C53169|nr:tetraspanin-33-like [Rhipicephalus sanguineus]
MSEQTKGQGGECAGSPSQALSVRSLENEETVLLDVNPAVRCPLLLLNLLLWFVGVSLMWAALRMYMDSWDGGEERVLERLDISGILLSHMEVLLFLFGLALFTITSCGCVGALRENTFLLRVYSFSLTVLIVFNFVLGILVFFVPGSIKSVITTTMSEKLVVHYRDSQDIQDLVDAVQRYLKCCGMTQRNFRDWNKNIYFHCDVSNPSHERCSVPPSCCRPESTFTGIFCGRSVLNMSDHDAWFRVHTGSCPDATNRYVKEHVMVIGGVCLIAVIVLAFIDMVTNAVIDEIDIIRRIYDHIGSAGTGVSTALTA